MGESGGRHEAPTGPGFLCSERSQGSAAASQAPCGAGGETPPGLTLFATVAQLGPDRSRRGAVRSAPGVSVPPSRGVAEDPGLRPVKGGVPSPCRKSLVLPAVGGGHHLPAEDTQPPEAAW